MNTGEIIVAVIFAILVGLAIRRIVKKGTCDCGCGKGGACPRCHGR